ncbi:MAG: UDP-N-acetylmuramoyl-tripeptide--D-alanyl-D-alanine ligase [Paludibacteraceae bacterium]|nr:UDP-N-acetylmuramoyl-tripeptide--D-alanyl-D-alanine ligase [Paludibacteraceae bacterium]
MQEITIKRLHEIFLASKGIVTDSRQCKPYTIFFALRGANFDGNDFAIKALNLGCQYAVVDKDGLGNDNRLIRVDDVLTTLQNLARYHRQQFDIPVLAVTGTNGKTTTKELLNVALSNRFKVLCTQGNLNNQIGVPLTLLRLKKEHTFAIIEMGASHPGDIKELCEIAMPNQGLITNVGKAHLLGFGSLQGVINTKTELYRYLIENDGIIYVNDKNPTLMGAIGGYRRVVNYPKGFELLPHEPMMSFLYQYDKFTTHLFGDHNYENMLAAVAVAQRNLIDVRNCLHALCSFAPVNNRSQLSKTQNNLLVVDAYNANPTSMSAAIRQFDSNQNYTNKIAILGDMLELGDASMLEHRTIIELLKNSNLYNVFLVGHEFCNAIKNTTLNGRVKDKFMTFEDTDAMLQFLKTYNIKGKTILLKGSRGVALEKIIPSL